MMFARVFMIGLIMLFTATSFAQDTILLINGRYRLVKVTELNPVEEYVSYFQTGKKYNKFYVENLKEVYSVSFRDSVRIVTYEQDTVTGMELNSEQMLRFIRGEQFALEHYKAPWVTVGGVAAGAAGPFLLKAYLGFLVPTAYCGTMGLTKINVKKQQEKFPDLFSDEFFVAGYQDRAKHKKVKNAIWGSLAGIGVGIVAYSIVGALN